MSAGNQQDDLESLVQRADDSVRNEHARAAAARAAAGPRRPFNVRGVLATIFGLGFLITGIIEFPRIAEPYLVPDPASLSVAEADVTVVADFVQMFQASQGRTPVSLEEVNMPEAVRKFAMESGVVYKATENDFSLTYLSPRYQVEFNSTTGKLLSQKVSQ